MTEEQSKLVRADTFEYRRKRKGRFLAVKFLCAENHEFTSNKFEWDKLSLCPGPARPGPARLSLSAVSCWLPILIPCSTERPGSRD